MKKWYLIILLVGISLFSACNDNGDEPEFTMIKIEKFFPCFYERMDINNPDIDVFELFNRKIFAINSNEQLANCPLFIHAPDGLQKEFSSCDFEKYTLVLAASSHINEIVDVKYSFSNRISFPEYKYTQTLYCRYVDKPIENIYLILNGFLVKKIPENSELQFWSGIYLIENEDQQ